MSAPLEALLGIMARLRGEQGCPWDRVQTFASIAPYTIEEAYEVADAIERDNMGDFRDELGDLLFQVVFLAQIAKEAGHFDFDAVAEAIGDKLVRRHPHVFAAAASHGREPGAGGAPAPGVAEQSKVWEDIKAAERSAAAATSAVDGVPLALPALMRAVKLSKRAARVGFDFERPDQTADKVAEELAEVREAVAAAPPGGAAALAGGAVAPSAAIFEEVGDLLFAAANLARKLEVDAEAALRAANVKFERRFRAMERLAAARGQRFDGLDLAAQEALWQDVKRGK